MAVPPSRGGAALSWASGAGQSPGGSTRARLTSSSHRCLWRKKVAKRIQFSLLRLGVPTTPNLPERESFETRPPQGLSPPSPFRYPLPHSGQKSSPATPRLALGSPSDRWRCGDLSNYFGATNPTWIVVPPLRPFFYPPIAPHLETFGLPFAP